jgi:hypothetical protein
MGPTGPAGDPTATIAVGTTYTSSAGGSASVSNGGTSTNAVLNFVIPRGPTGPTGPAGTNGIPGSGGGGGGVSNIYSGLSSVTSGPFYVNNNYNIAYNPNYTLIPSPDFNNGIYTAPSNGMYRVSVSGQVNGSASYGLTEIKLNGSYSGAGRTRGIVVFSNGYGNASLEAVLPLFTNDYFSIHFYGVSTVFQCTLTIYKIS